MKKESGVRSQKSGVWRAVVDVLRGIVDELTDQNAYRRHLAEHGVADSPGAWRRFQDEHWQAKARRGRCC